MYKKNKKKKVFVIIFVLILIAAVVVGFVVFKSKPKEAATTTEEAIELEKNQQLLNVTIKKILGNEMIVYYTDGDSSETSTWLIPVGTDVVTKLGTTTTFSRLASGDKIKMVVETVNLSQEIIKIWIVN